MASFKIFEEQYNVSSDYKLRTVSPTYENEEGTSHMREKLREVAAKFVNAVNAAKESQNASRQPQSTALKGVAALAQFHRAQQVRSSGVDQSKLNRKVVKYRQWLVRQGAKIVGECGIDWPATLSPKVVYDNDPVLQQFTKVSIRGGRLFTNDNKPLDTSKMVTFVKGPGAAIFVMSAQGNLHIHSHSTGHYHHSSLLAGAPVACAGELKVDMGRITWLSNKSGHYTPTRKNLLQLLALLQKNGVPLTFPLKVYPSEFNYNSVGEYMESQQLDDDSIAEVSGSDDYDFKG